MELAILFGILTLFFFLLLVYYLELLLFFFRERKRYGQQRGEECYLRDLEEKHKKTKHPQKKNFYLYLICLALSSSDEEKKANRLLPFLKNDPLLGVKKDSFLQK